MSLRSLVSEALEGGSWPARLCSPLAHLHAPLAQRSVARPLRLPDQARIVAVGSAVIGGAGKTPVSIAYARSLARDGTTVALVSHGYRAAASTCVRVDVGDDVRRVGDDALVAALELRALSVPVFVGNDRQSAIEHAARAHRVVVCDGLLQTRPDRVARSVLVVDGAAPLGSGRWLPAGDLRAPFAACLAACDEVVAVYDPVQRTAAALPFEVERLRKAWIVIEGARAETGHLVDLSQLSKLRLGLLLAVARPNRIRASLEVRGVRCVAYRRLGDHEAPSRRELCTIQDIARSRRLDAWLMTPKCRALLLPRDLAAPALTLVVRTCLDPEPEPVLDCASCVPEAS